MTKQCEELVQRLIASGRYNDADDVIHAALQKLAMDEPPSSLEVFPPGSLTDAYTEEANQAEMKTLRGLYLNVEYE